MMAYKAYFEENGQVIDSFGNNIPEIGEVQILDNKSERNLIPRKHGYHFCLTIREILELYEPNVIICEIKVLGNIVNANNVHCTDSFVILRVLEGIYINDTETAYFSSGILNRSNGPAYENIDGEKRYILRGMYHRSNGPAIISNNETIYYTYGEYHSPNSHTPAITDKSGDKYYYYHNVLHRDHGPAIEYANGDYQYWQNGIQTRSDGPASYVDGKVEYILDGLYHNKNGPAIVWKNGDFDYYENNVLHNCSGPALKRDLIYTYYIHGKKICTLLDLCETSYMLVNKDCGYKIGSFYEIPKDAIYAEDASNLISHIDEDIVQIKLLLDEERSILYFQAQKIIAKSKNPKPRSNCKTKSQNDENMHDISEILIDKDVYVILRNSSTEMNAISLVSPDILAIGDSINEVLSHIDTRYLISGKNTAKLMKAMLSDNKKFIKIIEPVEGLHYYVSYMLFKHGVYEINDHVSDTYRIITNGIPEDMVYTELRKIPLHKIEKTAPGSDSILIHYKSREITTCHGSISYRSSTDKLSFLNGKCVGMAYIMTKSHHIEYGDFVLFDTYIIRKKLNDILDEKNLTPNSRIYNCLLSTEFVQILSEILDENIN